MVNFSYDRDDGLLSRKRGISDQDCFLNASPDECGPASYSSYPAQGRFELLDAQGVATNAFNNQSLFTFNPDNSLVTGFPVGYGFNLNGVRRISVDRKSVVQGKSVSVRYALGGRRILKTKNTKHITTRQH